MTAAAERADAAAEVATRRRGPAEPAPGVSSGLTPEANAGLTGPPEMARPVRRPAASMNPRSMAMLQRTAGNAAVAGLVRARRGADVSVPATTGAGPAESSSADTAEVPVQRLAPGAAGGSTAPPVPPPAADPASDPKFRAVAGTVKSAGTALRKHPPAAAEVGKAQAAAKGPPDDKAGQAKAAQADAMAAAKPGGFDKAAFIAAVRKAIADAAPKNLDDADKFAESGKADGVKSQVMSQVTTGRDTSVRGVRDETARTPDASAGKDKPVTPLAPEPAAGTPPVDGAAAMPGPAPAEQVNFASGPAQVDQQMADAQVTEQHLAKSNEPQLQEAATAKKGAEAHAAAAPTAIRAHESAALGEAKAGAGAGATAAMAGMGRDKAGALARVAGAKTDTKSKDEVERARISGEINKIFDQTKAETEAILNGIDGKVTAEFDKGEGAARSAFTAKHKADMEKYKDDRYSGITGAARWTADLFTGLPAEANKIYDAAKALYESQMTVVISNVADLIGRELDAAKARVEKGRAQIKSFIAAQPAALQKLAGEAAKDVGGKFDQLDADVDAKQQSLVDDLASKYVEAKGKVDEEIKAEQEKNKGLVDKAKEAIGGAIDTILKLKALFTGLLAKAASAFTKILEDPVAFITNFMSAVKQGFLSFAGNILTHLKKGLLGWLFGALASAGIELPDSFDLKGILKLVGSILGLTWTNIKARIAKLAPWAAAAIDVIESKIEIFTILATQGIAGLWNWIKEKLGDLKSMILTPIMDFVKEKIITAGISWVIGMLNPAGALVKIVQALVGVVQWIMERGAALMDFVGTVIDSVTDIANGGVGGVPAKIEAALGKAVPLVIAFLANLLGLGGISDKIKSILKAVQAPINKALDAVIKGALKVAAPLIKGIKGLGAKAKAKVAAGKAWVKGKVEAGKARVTAGARAIGEKLGIIKRPLTLGGKPHTLTLTSGPKASLVMASTPELLVAKLRREVGLAQTNPAQAAAAQALIEQAEQHLELGRSASPADLALQTGFDALVRALSAYGRAYGVTEVGSREVSTSTDTAAIKAAISAAAGEKSTAVARHEEGGAVPGEVWASGGGRQFPQGAGPAPEGDGPVQEMTPHIAAQMAMFSELGPLHDVTDMTTLTPAAKAKLTILQGELRGARQAKDKVVKAEKERAIRKVLRSVNSYLAGASYPGRTKEGRDAHSAQTGQWLPRRSPRDQGTPGYADVVHAEKNVYRITRAQAIGVSTLPQCVPCQHWFKERAMADKQFIVVHSEVVRVFMPNGDVKSPDDFK